MLSTQDYSMGLFYSSPSKPNFFRIGRGPLPMRPQKIPGKAAPTWSLKMLNRIRVFPQNLALGMKTHTRYCQYERALPREKPPYRSRHGTPSVYPYFQCGRFSPVITAAARTGLRSGGFSSQSRKDKKRRRQRLSGAAFFASVDRGAGAFFPA